MPGEPSWAQWFAAYGAFVLHHARLAAELDVEMFCIGCEMVRATAGGALAFVVAQVQAVYGGLIAYDCDNYQEERAGLVECPRRRLGERLLPTGTWPERLDRIEAVMRREDKPFLLIEAGCPSGKDALHARTTGHLPARRASARRPSTSTRC